jgi:hypothetical protein
MGFPPLVPVSRSLTPLPGSFPVRSGLEEPLRIVSRHPKLIPELSREVTALSRGYEADHPHAERCRRFAEAGIDCCACPGTSARNPIGGRWPDAKINLAGATASGLEYGATGPLIADWGGNGQWQQLFHACAPGRARLEAPGLQVGEAAVPIRRAPAADMESLIERYDALWLSRSRSGGPPESAGRLERRLARYRGGELQSQT